MEQLKEKHKQETITLLDQVIFTEQRPRAKSKNRGLVCLDYDRWIKEKDLNHLADLRYNQQNEMIKLYDNVIYEDQYSISDYLKQTRGDI